MAGHGTSPAIAEQPTVEGATLPAPVAFSGYANGLGVRQSNGQWEFLAAHSPADGHWVEGGIADVGVPSLQYGVTWEGVPDGAQINFVSDPLVALPGGFELGPFDRTPLLDKAITNTGAPVRVPLTVMHTAEWDGADPAGSTTGGMPRGYLPLGDIGTVQLSWTRFGPRSSFTIEQRGTNPLAVDVVDTTVWGSGKMVGFRYGESSPGTIDWGDGSNTSPSYGGWVQPP